MKDKLTIYDNQKPIYDIVYSHNYEKLSEELKDFHIQRKKICIVTETNVAPLYLHDVINVLKPCCKKIISHTFPAGEEHKNLKTVEQIYETLIKEQFDRSDLLIALGGGVTGDITGYVAATYLRGIEFIQLPTTLLSQVDSSIGGKTGVDFQSYKNMVGAFHMPLLVYMNLNTLTTLGKKEYLSGMAEIIKHGLIRDKEYFQWIKSNISFIKQLDYHTIQEMIHRSCVIKGTVVANDPKEQGERALLNLGHTIGHAIEKLKNFTMLHGECVSIGIAGAVYLSKERGYILNEEYKDIIETLQAFELPISTDNLNIDEIYHATKLDKKMAAGIIKFILINRIGNAEIYKDVTDEELIKAINMVLN